MPLNRLAYLAPDDEHLPNVFQWGYEERMTILTGIRSKLRELNLADHLVFSRDGNFSILGISMDHNMRDGENVRLYTHGRAEGDTTLGDVIQAIRGNIRRFTPTNAMDAITYISGYGFPYNTDDILNVPELEAHEKLMTERMKISPFTFITNEWRERMVRYRKALEDIAEKKGKLFLDQDTVTPWTLEYSWIEPMQMDEIYEKTIESMGLPKNVEIARRQNFVPGFTECYNNIFGYAGIEYEPDMTYAEEVHRVACDLSEEYEEVVICILYQQKKDNVQVTIQCQAEPEESAN